MFILKDGRGTGYSAHVDSHGRVFTKGSPTSHIHHHTVHHGNSFNVYLRHIQQSSGTDELVGYIKYTGDEYLIISSILFTTTSSGMSHFDLLRNPTGLSGGVVTEPINLNFASKRTLDILSYGTNNGASAITFTDEGIVLADTTLGWRTAPTYFYDVQDVMALKKNDVFGIIVNSEYAGDIISLTVQYYEEPDEGMV